MKKSAGLFFAIVLTVTLMFLTAVTAHAAMAPGVTTRVYEGETIIYEKADKWDIVFSEIKAKYYSEWSDKASLKCVIEIERDCTIDNLSGCNYLPMPLTINLHGHRLELDHGDYWKFDHDLTINGDGGKITTNRSGDEYNCSFWIDSGYLSVNDVTIEKMKTNMSYPVFAMGNGCQVANILNCTFIGCGSSGYGGAICMEQTCTLNIFGCTFKSCSAYYGGAVYAEDIVNDGGSDAIRIDETTFDGCSAYYGGAIYIEDNNSDAQLLTFYIDHSSITDCDAEYDGGGIYCDCANSGFLAFLEISNCTAGRYGGGVFLAGNSTELNYGQISLCKAKYGGGIYCGDKNMGISNTCIHDCMATKAGGAYYTDYPSGDGKTYFSGNNLYANSPSDGNAGSVLSEGSLTIIVGVAALVLGLGGGYFLCKVVEKKKKLPEAADGEQKDKEE